jgi:hypothetical protein
MPHRGGGGSDLRCRIQAVLGLLLALPLLLWSGRGCAAGDAVFFNKSVATGSTRPQGCCEDKVLLAGRGGEGESQIGIARCPTVSLPADLGGEEELKRGALILDLGGGSYPLRRCCLRWRTARLQLPLACCGDEEGSGEERLLPKLCIDKCL